MTILLNKILFQSKQKKTELLGTYGIQSLPPQSDFGAISLWEITDIKEKKGSD
ncbi:hypothetical protein G9A89_022176 [Geosiphon pyriformis]|nr:hypothetical protein G9A89_022176 [Geosiphon pyriformis]